MKINIIRFNYLSDFPLEISQRLLKLFIPFTKLKKMIFLKKLMNTRISEKRQLAIFG